MRIMGRFELRKDQLSFIKKKWKSLNQNIIEKINKEMLSCEPKRESTINRDKDLHYKKDIVFRTKTNKDKIINKPL